VPIARLRDAASAGVDYGRSDSPDWRHVEWGMWTKMAAVAGRRVGYVELCVAEGAPVVFVHGLAGCWQHWLENLAPLARRHHVIALDLPGFGCSEAPPGGLSISGIADTIDGLCELLGIGPVTLVGNSMGGMIAAVLALEHPARVERLVLVDAAGLSIADAPALFLRSIVRLVAAFGATGPIGDRRVLRRRRARQLLVGGVVRHPSLIADDLLAQTPDGTGAPAFRPAVDAMLKHDLRTRLSELSQPTLICHGRNDLLVPVKDAVEFNRLIPGSDLLVFDDTGHMPMLERPRSFNAALAGFARPEERMRSPVGAVAGC
jgi:pimeloyl-ACP methyl ester carboxylesterase